MYWCQIDMSILYGSHYRAEAAIFDASNRFDNTQVFTSIGVFRD